MPRIDTHWESAGTGGKPLCGGDGGTSFNMFKVNCFCCLAQLSFHGHLPKSHPYYTAD